MSIKKISISVVIIVVFFLSGCTGGGIASSWPGVNIDSENAYISYGTGIMAVRSNNGSMVWRYPDKPDNRRSFYAQPTIGGDQVFIGDYAGTLYSLNKSNGSERWRYEVGSGRFIASPTYTNDKVIAASTDHYVYAVNQSGQLLWKYQTGQAVWSKPVANGERVYVASMDHMLYALDADTGEEVWKLDVAGAVVSNPVLDEENGLLILATIGGDVSAIRLDVPEIAWTFRCNGAVWSNPVISEDKVFIGDLTNRFYSLDLANGSQVWSMDLSAPVISSSVVFNEGLVVATEDGTIVKVSNNGDKVWTRTLTGNIYSTLVSTGELLLAPVTHGDAILYALDGNGNDRWSFTPSK